MSSRGGPRGRPLSVIQRKRLRGKGNHQCQKCLRLGHWTYECKAPDRVYQKRVSKTKILKNPVLRPSCIEKPPDMVKREEQEKRWKRHQKKLGK
eukprot:385445-Amorphochlora_amoeboformis.AAC.1